ncbi:hypothetical protein D3C72_1065280 [compost metagenome]
MHVIAAFVCIETEIVIHQFFVCFKIESLFELLCIERFVLDRFPERQPHFVKFAEARRYIHHIGECIFAVVMLKVLRELRERLFQQIIVLSENAVPVRLTVKAIHWTERLHQVHPVIGSLVFLEPAIPVVHHFHWIELEHFVC